MTDELRGTGASGDPWSVDLLADLHAGVLEPAQSARLWSQVNADPGARAVIDALDSVGADLELLRDAPAPPMPADFAARLDAAIEAESRRAFGGPQSTPQQAVAPVVDLAEARRKRSRRLAWGTGLLTAAAAAVAVTFAVLPGSQPTTGGVAAPATTTASAQPGEATNAPKPLAVTSSDVGGAVGKIGNSKEYGPLKDQAGLDKCIAAAGPDGAKAQTIGVHPVTLDGTEGIMALLTTGSATKLRVLVVQADCTVLFDNPIGR
ncbi:hypothetical protein [Alloactinosynnema sp. L-07]|uniref:hypothetical protein n=1 Tax=Alloactinosynnema sp. L-07 TaxID=1653480 RepID=UPI00065F039A|nr:hypothetical protein [Alloactinosynnema sp. L-07]CRK60696.1 hypothetical protein [Alloactinosynnema sp. L-07]